MLPSVTSWSCKAGPLRPPAAVLLLALVLVPGLLARPSRHRQQQHGGHHHHGHRNPSQAASELAERRLEMIKQNILSALGLTSPPNVTHPLHNIPAPLMDMEEESMEEEAYRHQYGKEDAKVVIFAKPAHNHFQVREKPEAYFHFALKENLIPADVTSADLWVYKTYSPGERYNQTLVVSELLGPNHSTVIQGSEIGVQEVDFKRGWVRFNINTTVLQWLQLRHRTNGLMVSCITCPPGRRSPVETKADRRPFIIIRTESRAPKRARRSLGDCTSSSQECCRDSMVVDFAQLGWGQWIVNPRTYTAYFCRGECNAEVQMWTNRRASVLTPAALAMVRGRENQVQPCCSPIQLSSLSFLYAESDGVYIAKNIEGMQVERCGCAS